MEYTYNRQGERTTKKDQNETVHAYNYDHLGRPIKDRVTAVGSGVDDAVRRIAIRYTVRGQVETTTSYDDPAVGSGTVLNEVRFVYNAFGQLTADYQSHSGAVDMVTTPKVAYAYTDGSSGHIRPTRLVYPNSRILRYEYSSGTDDALNRVSFLADDASGAVGTHLAEYAYLGTNHFVQVTYPEPNLRYDLAHGTGDDPYDGLDRFDRIIDLVWRNQTQGVDVERIQHGYDRAGNRLWRETPVAAANGANLDELYAYDGVNQLVAFVRGDLNAAKNGFVTGTKSLAQEWALDATGNWSGFKEDATGNGSWDLDQSRTHNSVNEITQLAGSSAHVAHDRVGNMTRMSQPDTWSSHYDLVYDAWNRLVTVADGEAPVAEYQYDGRNHRTATSYSGTARHYYYSSRWQVLEERVGILTSADRQLVWGLRYIDDLVLRDRDAASGGDLGTSGSGLDERLYAIQDANWNGVAVADASATVQERYVYFPYGKTMWLTDIFGSRESSSCSWDILYTGRCIDLETGLYHHRLRRYEADLGRFVSRDPIELAGDGLGLYRYCGDNPCGKTDPLGLAGVANVTYYDVSGPYYQLALKMSNEGPGGFWGRTTAQVGYRIEPWYEYAGSVFDPSCVGCRRYHCEIIAHVHFTVSDVTILLPHWTDYDTGTPAQKKAWDQMIYALEFLHEMGHVALFVGFGGVEDAYGTGSSCTRGKACNAAMRVVFTQGRQMYQKRLSATESANKIYDDITENGGTQGVELPQI